MIRKLFIPVALFAFVVLASATAARADDWDQKTSFAINQPVSIQGQVVLPAGSYVIKRLSTTTPVVQILNSSETKVYATLLPAEDVVQQAPEKPTFTFQEMPEGSPAMLRTWHYPGTQIGYEFLNPKTE